MNNDSLFGGITAVTRYTASICSTFWLFSFIKFGHPSGIKLLPFWMMSVSVFLIIKVFLRKPRSQNALIALALLLFAAESAVILLFCFDIPDLTAAIFALISVGLTITLSVLRCIEPISHSKSLNSMELTVIYFIFFLWAQTVEEIEFQYSLPLLFASVLSIADIMRMRISGIDDRLSSNRKRSIAAVIIILAATLIPISLFTLYGAKPLSHGVTMLFYAVFYCIDMMCKAFISFIIWLASLFPPPEGGWIYEKKPYEFDIDDLPEKAQPDPNALLTMQVVFLIAAILLLLLILYRFRHRKIGGKMFAKAGGAVERKKLSFLSWFKSIFAAAKKKIIVSIRIMLARGSSKELYLFVLKKGRALGLHRLHGETPCAFVIRAAQMTENVSEEIRGALLLLSQQLSLSLYSNHNTPKFPKEQAQLIRRGFRKALRKARFKSLKNRINALLTH